MKITNYEIIKSLLFNKGLNLMYITNTPLWESGFLHKVNVIIILSNFDDDKKRDVATFSRHNCYF